MAAKKKTAKKKTAKKKGPNRLTSAVIDANEALKKANASCENMYNEPLSKQPNYSLQSKYFCFWALKDVVYKEHDDLYPDEFEPGWMDYGAEKDGDYFSRDPAANKVIVAQSKLQTGKKFNKQHLTSILSLIDQYHDSQTDSSIKLHQDIKDEISDVDWGNDQFIVYYLTSGRIPPDTLNEFHKKPLKVGGKVCGELRVYGGQELIDNQKLYSGNLDKLPTGVKLKINGGKDNFTKIDKPFESYYFLCDPKIFREVIKNKNLPENSLFARNFRYWKDTGVNYDLQESAKLEPHNFVYYNNGVSCIASKVVKRNDTLTADNLQVINGAQTLTSLSKLTEKQLEEVLIPVRLTKIEDLKSPSTANGAFLKNVVTYNNKQNPMAPFTHLSGEKFHGSFKEYIDGQKVKLSPSGAKKSAKYYDRDQDISKKQKAIIEPVVFDDLYKKCYAFFFEPHVCNGNVATLWKLEKQPLKTFIGTESDGKTLKSELDADKIKEYLGAYWIITYLSVRGGAITAERSLHKEVDPQKFRAIERAYHIAAGIRLAIKQVHTKKWRSRLREFANPLWIHDSDPKMRGAVTQYFRASLAGCYGSMAQYLKTVPKGMTKWKSQSDSLHLMEDHIRTHLSIHEYED